jgi:hypothetical protein
MNKQLTRKECRARITSAEQLLKRISAEAEPVAANALRKEIQLLNERIDEIEMARIGRRDERRMARDKRRK